MGPSDRYYGAFDPEPEWLPHPDEYRDQPDDEDPFDAAERRAWEDEHDRILYERGVY